MFGDAPPLIALVPTEDPHGLVDSFLFGVSLNRIAYQVPDAGELFVMPSGTGPLDYAELFGREVDPDVDARPEGAAADRGDVGAGRSVGSATPAAAVAVATISKDETRSP